MIDVKRNLIALIFFIETLDAATDVDSPSGEKIAWSEAGGIGTAAFQLAEPVGQIGALSKAIAQKTPEERAQLVVEINEELDLKNDKVEAIVEALIEFANHTYNLILKIREAKKAA